MKLMKVASLLSVSFSATLLATVAFSAEEIEPALQRQISMLEAKANAVPISSSIGQPASGTLNTADAAIATLAGTSVAKVPEKVPEAEIPVLTKFNKKVEVDSLGTPTRVLATFGIVIGILVGSIFFLRRYTKSHSSKVKHTQIRVTAQHHLGPKKSIAIIRVAGESILIGVTDQSITMLKQLHILDEDMAEEEVTEDFRQRLERSTQEQAPRAALAQKPTAKPAAAPSTKRAVVPEPRVSRPPLNARQVFESNAQDELNDNEEFMMRGIRDIVSDRLRNRKTLV